MYKGSAFSLITYSHMIMETEESELEVDLAGITPIKYLISVQGFAVYNCQMIFRKAL